MLPRALSGATETGVMSNLTALPDATVLAGDFRIERVLGAGGFGITYLAEERTLARRVTIKEYFPTDFAARDGTARVQPRGPDCAADYRWGLDRFIDEAKTLARFDHPNIVRVHRYFRANNTGYMVLGFEEGKSLKAWLKGLRRAPRQHELDRIVGPLLDALTLVHADDYLHRDIAPDNIIVRPDGTPVLIDFGSARGDMAQHSKTVSALVKPGYSPYEQYATSGRQQGPWTDIYSLAATLYHAVTGKRPPDAPSRMVADEIVPARDAALSSYRPGFLAAIDQALSLDINARPRTIADWRATLLAAQEKVVEPAAPAVAIVGTANLGPEPIVDPRPEPVTPATPVPPIGRRLLGAFRDGSRRQHGAAGETDAPASRDKSPADAASQPRAEAATPPLTIEKRTPPSPARPRRRIPWRSLAAKAAVGIGVASVAVAFQDHWRPREREGSQTLTTGTIRPPPPLSIEAHKGAVLALAFGDDGQTFATAGADGRINVWRGRGTSPVRTVKPDGNPTKVAIYGQKVAWLVSGSVLSLLDLASGKQVAALGDSGTGNHLLAHAGPGDRMVVSRQDSGPEIVAFPPDAPTSKRLDAQDASPVRVLAGCARCGLVATATGDRAVRLWSSDTARLRRTYRGHDGAVTALALAPSGRLLASGADDGVIRIWSANSSRTRRLLRVPGSGISALAFTADGRLLAAAAGDGTIRLWDMRRIGQPLLRHDLGKDATTLAFSPDGRQLAVGTRDGRLRLWVVAGQGQS